MREMKQGEGQPNDTGPKVCLKPTVPRKVHIACGASVCVQHETRNCGPGRDPRDHQAHFTGEKTGPDNTSQLPAILPLLLSLPAGSVRWGCLPYTCQPESSHVLRPFHLPRHPQRTCPKSKQNPISLASLYLKTSSSRLCTCPVSPIPSPTPAKPMVDWVNQPQKEGVGTHRAVCATGTWTLL